MFEKLDFTTKREVAAACRDYTDCSGNKGTADVTFHSVYGDTHALYCNSCGTITPHTCPPVDNCKACDLLIRAGEDTWEDIGWGELVEFRTTIEKNFANAGALNEADRARYTAISAELVKRSREDG